MRTKGKWYVFENSSYYTIKTQDDDTFDIARIEKDDTALEDAEHIVKCVNEREKLVKGIIAVRELINHSSSVVGLHLNGDYAPWDDLLEGGEGNDTLSAGAGDDVALGEAGIDDVQGGGDTDTVAGGGNGIAADAADVAVGETIDDDFTFDAAWVNV